MKYPFVKRSISRYIYLVVLLGEIYGFLSRYFEDPQLLTQATGLGVSWWIFYLFSFILLLHQAIFNNKIGWFIIAGCIFYTFIISVLVLLKQHPPAIVLDVIMFGVIYLLFIMLYPRKRITTKKKSN